MYRTIGGIDLDAAAPGYHHARIAPRPGAGLTSARASLETAYGPVASAWHVAGGRFTLEVTIPPNSSADVVLHDTKLDKVQESGHPLDAVAGIRATHQEGTDLHLEVGSGQYRFTTNP